MSWLSVLKNDLVGVFQKAAAVTPSATNSVNNVNNAVASIEAEIPVLVEAGVNYCLSLVPGGPAYTGLADEILTLVIAALEAKKSTAAPVS